MTSHPAAQFPAEARESWVPLLELAVREVFRLMLGSELTTSTADTSSPTTITSMVGLAGSLCGVLSVSCDQRAATLITSKMLGVELNEVGDEMSDAMGEVANMVAGNFKNKIAGMSDGCLLSPPTIITGNNYSMHSLTDSPAPLEIRLMIESMPIIISLQVHS